MENCPARRAKINTQLASCAKQVNLRHYSLIGCLVCWGWSSHLHLAWDSKQQEDIWDVRAAADAAPEMRASLSIEIVDGVEPLDDQLAMIEKKTVPDALRKILFEDPLVLKQDHDPKQQIAQMHTYAILDGAKVPQLSLMLEASGLPHRCLFRGTAFKELKDVAPWIVQLEEGNAFCRHLFTSGKAHWQLWDKAPGIFLRSRASLDALWRHVRKFTRIQDETGKWFYFRFYDPTCVAVSQPLLLAIDRSIRHPLPHPARLIVTGPHIRRPR